MNGRVDIRYGLNATERWDGTKRICGDYWQCPRLNFLKALTTSRMHYRSITAEKSNHPAVFLQPIPFPWYYRNVCPPQYFRYRHNHAAVYLAWAVYSTYQTNIVLLNLLSPYVFSGVKMVYKMRWGRGSAPDPAGDLTVLLAP